jgi:hypothetical protein
MALIDSEDAAGRLARVIVSDIELYNQQKLASGANLAAELEEGYAHFRARVVPALLPLFEMVLATHVRLAGQLPRSLAGGQRPPVRPSLARAPAETVAPVAPAAAEEVFSAVDDDGADATQVDAPVAQIAMIADLAARLDRSRDDRDVQDDPSEAQTAPVALEESPPLAPPADLAPPSAPPADLAPPSAPPADLAPPSAPPAADPAPAATPEEPASVDPETAARRLARVIISDIQIYNPDKIANGDDLTREINEGRALFRSRVEPTLLPLFEAMLAEHGLGTAGRPAPVRAAAPSLFAPAPRPRAITPAPRRAPTPTAVDASSAPTPLMTAVTPPPSEAPTPHLAAPPATAETPTPAPARTKPRPRAVPPPLPVDERPRWAASEPALPVDILARLPAELPPETAPARTETPSVVVTLSTGFTPTPVAAPPGLFDEAPPYASGPVFLPAPAPSSSTSSTSSPSLPRAPVIMTAPVSAARQLPTGKSRSGFLVALVIAAAAVVAFLVLRG